MLPQPLYSYEEVAKRCWQLNPKERSTFTDLVDFFESYLTSEEQEEYRRLEDKYVEIQNIIDTTMLKTMNSNSDEAG